jgi:predicted transcriptional regulator
MDALFAMSEGTVAGVRDQLPDPPGYDAVRTTLRILERKGAVAHREEGGRYLYRPAVDEEAARRTAIQRVVDVFFGGSPERAALALLRSEDAHLSVEEVARLERLIEDAAESDA